MFEDKDIIRLYFNGDKNCLDILIERYKLPLYRFCHNLTLKRDEADDLFQETWLKAIQKLNTFDVNRSLLSWLYSICINSYKDKYRKKKRWLNKLKEYFSADTMEMDMNSIQSSVPIPEDLIILSEEKLRLKKCLNELDDIFRIPLILFYFKELSYSDISEILFIPIGTVKSRLNLGKKKLKERMEVDLHD